MGKTGQRSKKRDDARGRQPQKRQQATGAYSQSLAISGDDGQTVQQFAPATTLPSGYLADVEAPELAPDKESVPAWRERTAGLSRVMLGRMREYGSRVWWWLRGLSVESWLWIAVVGLASVLRFWDLGNKPMHHDESMHAYFSLVFTHDPASYAYNPLLHGPFQFHAEGLVFAIIIFFEHIFQQAQAWGDPWITNTSARFLPAAFGVGIVALAYGLRRWLGREGALIAAFLIAVSPAFVYFSRFLREDIYFNFFMFGIVVAALHFSHTRSTRHLLMLVAAFVLAYATFEGIFLTTAIFAVFLAVIILWEIAHSVAKVLPQGLTPRERLFFSRAGLLLLAGTVASAVGLSFLRALNVLSAAINKSQATQQQADLQVQRLQDATVSVLLYLSILIALVVIITLIWQMYRDDVRHAAQLAESEQEDAEEEFEVEDNAPARVPLLVDRVDRVLSAPARFKSRLHERLDPERQPFLHLLLGITWVQWFLAFVCGWIIFAALYWILPGDGHSAGQGFQQGIGSGIWQGLYYWLKQQNVARGGQPWYYYLFLLPLYEQIICVFALVGVAYALRHPTRFRLFLVWWFVASLGLYSWAGEKMPWLSIHILLPMALLAAMPLAACYRECVRVVRLLRARDDAAISASRWRVGGGVLGGVVALLLLITTLHGMQTLVFAEPANGPHEMMIYVQTTPDVTKVMQKIREADQKLYGGTHQLKIAVGPGEEWPFYWYLRNYPNTTYGYNAASPDAPAEDVLILYPAGDSNGSDAQTFMKTHASDYQAKEYQLRSWWNEGYKPPPCVQTATHSCPPSTDWGYGVGVGNYLSYGDTPPANAQFNLGLAAHRVWNWLWLRQPFGSTDGSYNFTFIVHNSVPVHP